MNEPRWLFDRSLERPHGVAEDAVARVLRVPPEAAGMRLDVFLSAQLRNTSRTRAKLIAENSAHDPEGNRLRSSGRVRAEDRIVLWRSPVDDVADEVELETLYQDEHLLVINKPPHLTVHPTARHYNATVMKVLERTRPDEFFSLIHRLDKETSGILLLARSPAADRAFKILFEGQVLGETGATKAPVARSIEKTYLAITWGTPVAGLIDKPVEQDPENSLRVKMRIASPGQGLEARTSVTIVEEANGYAVVCCKLLTGRQHQIRVHLAAMGCPVVGDKLYGPDDRMLARAADGELSDDDLIRLELPRQALHAERYRLPHAVTGEMLELYAPPPADLQAFWQRVSGHELPK